MRTKLALLSALFTLVGASGSAAPAESKPGSLVVSVANTLDVDWPSATIELTVLDIVPTLATDDLRKIHVRDEKLGREIVSQAIDMDGNLKYDLLVFQVDLAARETRKLSLTLGERQAHEPGQFKVYGRFARERYDDFLWENDRVAYRMYGRALETRPDEPLTSSTVDVWCKRTRDLIVNDFLMVDDYHVDHGQGGDFYSAGATRGAGGSCIWENGRLACSRNFVNSRVLACGPIRLVFELTYEPWALGRKTISEVKRITLDAGSSFNRFDSFYTEGLPTEREISYAIGLKNAKGSTLVTNAEEGWMRTWERLGDENGNLGLALVFDPAQLTEFTEADGNYLAVLKLPQDRATTYYAGSGWDKSGDVADVTAWEAQVRGFVQRLRSPLKVTLGAAK